MQGCLSVRVVYGTPKTVTKSYNNIEGVCWFLLLPCLLSQKIDGSIFCHPWLNQWITPKCIAMTYSWLQCTCATVYMCSVSMALFHYTCATVYMCSVSMAVFYSLYMCYSVHVLSLHDWVLFIIHVLQCTCDQSPWLCFIHCICATVYMCSVSMTVFYSLFMCYSVHVTSLHGSVLFNTYTRTNRQ